VLVATIFLSGSRGGVIAFFAQAAFLALVFARGRQHRRKIAITACFAFIFLAGLFAFGRGSTLERLASLRSPLSTEIAGLRLAVLKDSHAMLHERPVLGWGLGTFQYVYPQFRSFYTNYLVDHAHNDYLEFLIETGLLGFAGVLWFVIVLLRSGWQKLPHWKTGLTGTVKIGAMAGCIAILVHSLVDFNLQITANAALFYVLATMVAGNSQEASGL
jgi:O-antigen ligase